MNAGTAPWFRRLWKPVAAVAGMAAITAYSTGGCAPKTPPGRVEAPAGEPLPDNVVTQVVRRVARPGRAEVPGTFESESRIQISAKIPAHVRRVLVAAGSEVKAGQELVLLDDREIREQLAAAEAQARQAEAEYRRTRSLFESKAATEQQMLAAETARAAAAAQVERVKVMLSYARIVSPIDGIVTDRRVEEGDLAAPGMVLMSVYDPTRMRLEAPVPVRLIDRVATGRTVEVVLTHPEGRRRGTVSEIVSEIDPASRTQKVKVRLEDPTGLRPGAFGRLVIGTEPTEQILLPEVAVRRVGQLELVGVLRDGRLVRRLVRTGRREGGVVEILAGLEDGEVVAWSAGGREG